MYCSLLSSIKSSGPCFLLPILLRANKYFKTGHHLPLKPEWWWWWHSKDLEPFTPTKKGNIF